VLPEKFTVEIDLIFRKVGDGWSFVLNGGPTRVIDQSSTLVEAGSDGIGVVGGAGGKRPMTNDEDNRVRYRGKLAQLRILGDGKYLKVFLDERRLANVPNTNFVRAKAVTLLVGGSGEANPVFVGKSRVAASRQSIYDDLAAKGRISTQGSCSTPGATECGRSREPR
jgi:hypothetical protein